MDPTTLNILLKLFGDFALVMLATGEVTAEQLKAMIDSEETRSKLLAERGRELGER